MDRGTFEGTLDRQTEDWSTENRSLAKADSTKYGIGKVASALEDETTYYRPNDWVYASPAMNGTQPVWPNSIFRVYSSDVTD